VIQAQLEDLIASEDNYFKRMISRFFFKRNVYDNFLFKIKTLNHDLSRKFPLIAAENNPDNERRFIKELKKTAIELLSDNITYSWGGFKHTYNQWISQLSIQLKLYDFILNNNDDHNEKTIENLQAIIADVITHHDDLFIAQQGLLSSWYYWWKPLPCYSLMEKRINALMSQHKDTLLRPIFSSMLHTEIMIQLLEEYQADLTKLNEKQEIHIDESFFSDVKFATLGLKQLQESIDHTLYTQFKDSIRPLFNDRKESKPESNWTKLYSSLLQRALMIQYSSDLKEKSSSNALLMGSHHAVTPPLGQAPKSKKEKKRTFLSYFNLKISF
jgi:hypothetical protein